MGTPDKTAFIAMFKTESDENLSKLTQNLLKLEKQPADKEILKELFRAAHTLKGGAGMMGYPEIESVAHRLEDLFDQIQKGQIAFGTSIANACLKALDAIGSMLNAVVVFRPLTGLDSAARQTLDACFGRQTAQEPALVAAAVESPAVPGTAEETIRVPIGRINSLLNLIGELVIHKVKSSYKLDSLRQLVRRQKTTEKQLSSLVDVLQGMDATPTGRQALQLSHQTYSAVKRLREDLSGFSDNLAGETLRVDPVIDEVQFKIKELRMLPCATIFEGLERLVRDLSVDQKKRVDFVVQGEETQLDKRVLEAVKPCLIHMLRNAVDHGMETPEMRVSAGKPPLGTVRLGASQRGARVFIEVADDGCGISVEEVRETAIKKKLATAEEMQRMNESEQLSLIFAPGFTTSAIITGVSGRGVGMDVVRRDIEKLKGVVRVQTAVGKGTTFTIELPLTVAVVQILLVEAQGQKFGLPLSSIDETLAVRPQDVQSVDNHAAIRLRDRIVPVVKMMQVLRLPGETSSVRDASRHIPVVVVSSMERQIGLEVDRILGEEEIFIKSLGKHLGNLKSIGGAAILGTGEVIAILDVSGVTASLRSRPMAVKAPPSPHKKRTILLVEDSLTTRELEKNVLEAHGYVVETAVDGLEALEKVARGGFDLVISDVQMPRMDGLEFCRAMRQLEGCEDLPLIFLTTLESEEEKRRGIEVGAQAYLTKGAFDQEKLLDMIKRFTG